MCRIFRSRGLQRAPPKSTSSQKTLHILTPTILLERIWICYWTNQVGIENRVVEISKLRQLKYMWTFLNYDTIIQWLFQPPLTQIEIKRKKYRIYSINRPGRLLNFWTLGVGAYSRWELIRGWALIRGWVLTKFSTFSASAVRVFCNKTISGNNKTRGVNRARFL